MTQRRSAIVALLAILPIVAKAQQPNGRSRTPVVTVGSQVRIASSAVTGQTRGTVVVLDDSVLTLLTEGDRSVLKFPLASITSLEMRTGQRRYTLAGLAIGAVFMGIVYGTTEPVDPADCGENGRAHCSRGDAVLVNTLAGGIIGAAVGYWIRTDRWGTVTLGTSTARAQLNQLAPGIRISLHF